MASCLDHGRRGDRGSLLSACHDLLVYAGHQGRSLAELCRDIRRSGKYPLAQNDATASKQVEEVLESSRSFVRCMNRYTLLSIFLTELELQKGASQEIGAQSAGQSGERAGSVSEGPETERLGTGEYCATGGAALCNGERRASVGCPEASDGAVCESAIGMAEVEGNAGPPERVPATRCPGSAAKSSGESPAANESSGRAVQGLLTDMGGLLNLDLNAAPEDAGEAKRTETVLEQAPSTDVPGPALLRHPRPSTLPVFLQNEGPTDAGLSVQPPDAAKELSGVQPTSGFNSGPHRIRPLTLGASLTTASTLLPAECPSPTPLQPATPMDQSRAGPSRPPISFKNPSNSPPKTHPPPSRSSPAAMPGDALGLLQAYDSDEEDAPDQPSASDRSPGDPPEGPQQERVGGARRRGSDEGGDLEMERECGTCHMRWWSAYAPVGGLTLCGQCTEKGRGNVTGKREMPAKGAPQVERRRWSLQSKVSKATQCEDDVKGASNCKRCGVGIPVGRKVCDEHSGWAKRRRHPWPFILAPPKGMEIGASDSEEEDSEDSEESEDSDCPRVRCKYCESDAEPGLRLCTKHNPWTKRRRDALTPGKVEVGGRGKGGAEIENGVDRTEQKAGNVGSAAVPGNAAVGEKEESWSKSKCKRCEKDATPGSTLCKWHKGGLANKRRRQLRLLTKLAKDRGGPARETGQGGGQTLTCGHGKKTCTRPRLDGSKLCLEHYACLPGVKRLLMGQSSKNSPSAGGVKRRAEGEEEGARKSEKPAKASQDEERVERTVREIKKLGAGMSVDFGVGKRKVADAVRAKYAEHRAKRARKEEPLTSATREGDVSTGGEPESAGERRCVQRDGRWTWQCKNAAAPGVKRCQHHLDLAKRNDRKRLEKVQLMREGQGLGSANGGSGRHTQGGQPVKGVLPQGGNVSQLSHKRCKCGSEALPNRVRCQKCNDRNNRHSFMWRIRKEARGDVVQEGTKSEKQGTRKGVIRNRGLETREQKPGGERKCNLCKRAAADGKRQCAEHIRKQSLYYKRWYAAKKAAAQAEQGSPQNGRASAKVDRPGRTRDGFVLGEGKRAATAVDGSGEGVETGYENAGVARGGFGVHSVDPPAVKKAQGEPALAGRCGREICRNGEMMECGNVVEKGEEYCELHSDWLQQVLALKRAKARGDVAERTGKGGEGARKAAKDVGKEEVVIEKAKGGAALRRATQGGAVLALPTPRVKPTKPQRAPSADPDSRKNKTESRAFNDEVRTASADEHSVDRGGSKHSGSDPLIGAVSIPAQGVSAPEGGSAQGESRPPGRTDWTAQWRKGASKKLEMRTLGGFSVGEDVGDGGW